MSETIMDTMTDAELDRLRFCRPQGRAVTVDERELMRLERCYRSARDFRDAFTRKGSTDARSQSVNR